MPSHKNTNVKMLHLVNMKLKMSKGKIAAQVSHGAVGMYRQLIKTKGTEKMLLDWETKGEKAVALKIKNINEINRLISKIDDKKNIHYHTVKDAGMTEVKSGSLTILTIFGYENTLSQWTGHLKTL